MKRPAFVSNIVSSILVVAVMLCFAQTSHAQYPSVSGAPSVDRTGKNDVALVVAVEDYAFLPDVGGAVATANDWETYFRKGLGMKTVYVRADERATREDILEFAKRAASDVDKGATLWFVFVGHGAPTKDGKDGLLVGADAQGRPSSLKARGVKRAELLETLGKGKQKRTVAIFDACFSGKSSPNAALAKGLQPVVPTQEAKADASTLVLSAAAHDQYAGALPGAGRPAFSYALLGALRGWADDGDGKVTAAEAIGFARRNLRYLDHAQTPQLSGESDVVLARGVREKDPGLGHHMNKALRQTKPAAAAPSRRERAQARTGQAETSTQAQSSGVEHFDKGAEYYAQKQYKQAHEHFLRGCRMKNDRSCSALGVMYKQGQGVEKDEALAVEFFKYGCTYKDADSCFLVGFYYQRGTGVAQDHLEALKYLKEACSSDHPLACSGIAGMFYDDGLGVKPDARKASHYGQKACRLGNNDGCYYAGFAEADRQNYGLAAELYRKACDGGSLSACTNLGNLYLRGNGVEQDQGQAMRLYHKACKQGAATACNNLRVLQE